MSYEHHKNIFGCVLIKTNRTKTAYYKITLILARRNKILVRLKCTMWRMSISQFMWKTFIVTIRKPTEFSCWWCYWLQVRCFRNLPVHRVIKLMSLSSVEGLLHKVAPAPSSVTSSIEYWVPAVNPIIVRFPEECMESTALRVRWFGLGSMLITEKLSKVELEAVAIPLPYMVSDVIVDDITVTIGTSGTKNQGKIYRKSKNHIKYLTLAWTTALKCNVTALTRYLLLIRVST